jgi:hypothetical protein
MIHRNKREKRAYLCNRDDCGFGNLLVSTDGVLDLVSYTHQTNTGGYENWDTQVEAGGHYWGEFRIGSSALCLSQDAFHTFVELEDRQNRIDAKLPAVDSRRDHCDEQPLSEVSSVKASAL